MADVKISALPASTTPLAGTEVLPIVQGTTTKQVSVANLTAGRAVSALTLSATSTGAFGGNATVGTANANANVLVKSSVAAGGAGFSEIYFGNTTSDTQGYVSYSHAANNILFGTSGTTKATIFGSGGVSIGNTTDPGAGSLSVTGTSTANAASSISLTNLQSSTNAASLNVLGTSFSYAGLSGSDTLLLAAAGGALDLATFDAKSIRFVTNASIKATLFTSGGLSIGNITDPGTAGLRVSGLIYPQQATTAAAPAYVKGAIYFDTTLNKLRVGGATAWETITSV